jgi:hypothetical protein
MQLTEITLFRLAMVLVAASILLHATSYYLQIAVLHVIPSRFPYWWSIFGSALMNVIPIGLWRSGSMRFAFGFALFTFVTGIGMCYFAFVNL